MNKRIILTASFFGALAVIFGAFGAHTLKNIINEKQLDVWQTAVQYHFYHTFAILFLSTFSKIIFSFLINNTNVYKFYLFSSIYF